MMAQIPTLDKKDKRLLSILYQNSRMSFIEMGKKLQLSSSSVERRMRKLREAGVLSLLLANIDFFKLGLKSYHLYFRFDVMDEKTEEGILELFESYPRTLWGVICEGEYDVLWRVIEKDELDVEKAAYLMMERFGERIVGKSMAITTYQMYLPWNKAFETGRRAPLPVQSISRAESIDERDMGLLRALYSDSRETTVSLSRKVGLTSDAVQRRIRRLTERGIIMGYTAWFDAKKLGFNYYKVLIGFRSATKEKEREFLAFCRERDEAVFVNKTLGAWDVEVDIIVRNNEELHAFIREIKTRFGHILGKHTFVTAIEERMLNPLR